MSVHTDNSAWSPDEADSLENLDKEVQLVSTSTESHSASHNNGNGSGGHKKPLSGSSLTDAVSRQSDVNILHSKSHDNFQAIKCNSRNDDSHVKEQASKLSSKTKACTNVANKHQQKALNNQSNEISQDIERIIKSRMVNSAGMTAGTPILSAESNNKQDYLEQINRQLTKELDEKNAILSLLQENYEHLLFKYAEAQNRIDELRIKFLAEKPESCNCDGKQEILNNHIPYFYCEDYSTRTDSKPQKGVVTPYINLEEAHSPVNESSGPPASRPSSLPLESGLKFNEKDLLKAATPTDSEGLSSIITSMSGHSKILNSLDEENQINKKPNFFKSKRNLMLHEITAINDPFDKVKNWQNSLPPLEQIETPETTLYNINNTYSSTETNYKEITSPKLENEYNFSDESCPLSWREETLPYQERDGTKQIKISSQVSSLNNSQLYSKKIHNSAFEKELFQEDISVKGKSPHYNVPSSSIIKKRHKRPPLLRCSSLPAYDHESVKSESKKEIYIPPLDLNNVTLSDDESYCQQDYYLNKSNPATSSSFISSRDDSLDPPLQTPKSFSSCKVTISEERFPRQINKSTSITPERCKIMDCLSNNDCTPTESKRSSSFFKECSECSNINNICKVCGESISGGKNDNLFGNRANSCESVHKRDFSLKETSTKKTKPPFKRSVSFGSGTNTPRFFPIEKSTPKMYFSNLNEDSLESFDAYTKNLKTRSEIAIKALTAHVNNP